MHKQNPPNMTNFTTTNSTAPPPSAAAQPHNSDMSPLSAAVCLVALVTIPMISYSLFMAIRCPRNPFRRRPAAPAPPVEVSCVSEKIELVCGVKFRKTTAGGGGGGGNGEACPVCLSVFAEGEEIRQLSVCNHAFHAACVDMWLYSHSSCPVCRAAVPVKRVLAGGADDFRRDSPDAASLI